jgi:hypothetical protein
MGGELDVGGRAGAVALCDNVSGATFALATLGGDTQFELDLVEAHAGVRVAGYLAIRNSAADTNDHGLACWLVIRCVDYKCESIAFATTSPNPGVFPFSEAAATVSFQEGSHAGQEGHGKGLARALTPA